MRVVKSEDGGGSGRRPFALSACLKDPPQTASRPRDRRRRRISTFRCRRPASGRLSIRRAGARIDGIGARESGAISEDQSPGYFSAVVVRANDPVVLPEVRQRLRELGLGSFSIVESDWIRFARSS